MAREFVIYCDESEKHGTFAGNFYGGVLVTGEVIDRVKAKLEQAKQDNHLGAELKWKKVTDKYLAKYKGFVDRFFDLLAEERLKFRVMFIPTALSAPGLDSYQRDNAYFLLYYQFIKHAFGLRFAASKATPRRVRIYLDNLPDTTEKRAVFKAYLAALSHWPEFIKAGIFIDPEQIAEVESRNHVLLQAVDVVLGAMQFRLNDKHLEKAEGTGRRGKRTIAKEKLYKHILGRIRGLHPRFNIGITTGTSSTRIERWTDPYRHWRFVPNEATMDRTLTKGKNRRG